MATVASAWLHPHGKSCFAMGSLQQPQTHLPRHASRVRLLAQNGRQSGEASPSARGQPSTKPAAEQEDLLPLWEQWGLLGLACGLLVASGAVDALIPDFDLGGLDIKAAEQQLQGAVAGVTASVTSGLELFPTIEGDGTAVVEEGEAIGALVGEEVAMISIVSAGDKAVLAGTFGAAGSIAGLLADTAQEPMRERDSEEYIEVSQLTPGTVRGNAGNDFEERPMSALQLGTQKFMSEVKQLLRAARFGSKVQRRHVPSFVPSLVLSNEAVMERERARPEVPTPVPVRLAYDVLCWFIDVVFEDRPIQRFWFLETVARMPYFSYMSVLHLYETLGWWRSPELRAVHAAEEDNELHHLLIMECLGGDQRWLDRFFAQHGALAYYWTLALFFVIDPRWSYNFSRLIESHAVDTYGEFVDANAERLRSLPPPPVAVEYYLSGDWYLFDKFQTALTQAGKLRRPPCSTLYDVFCNIRDDEEQHVLTMEACEEWVAGAPPAVKVGFNQRSNDEYAGMVSRTTEGRAAWESWGAEVMEAARAAERGADFRQRAHVETQ